MKPVLVALLALAATPALAIGPEVVRPLGGLVCTRLVATEQQMLNPKGTGIFILAAPRADAPHLTTAPSVVFAKAPTHVVSGYAEVVTINGEPGWIEAGKIKPFDPLTRCVPSLMSNGRIGAG